MLKLNLQRPFPYPTPFNVENLRKSLSVHDLEWGGGGEGGDTMAYVKNVKNVKISSLVDLYLLSKLPLEYGISIGLLRDDGLAALDKTPKEFNSINKNICREFSTTTTLSSRLKKTNENCVHFFDFLAAYVIKISIN